MGAVVAFLPFVRSSFLFHLFGCPVLEEIVNVIVECGAVPALVKHLRAPPVGSERDEEARPFEHEVEKGSAFALGLLAVKVRIRQCFVGLSHVMTTRWKQLFTMRFRIRVEIVCIAFI